MMKYFTHTNAGKLKLNFRTKRACEKISVK